VQIVRAQVGVQGIPAMGGRVVPDDDEWADEARVNGQEEVSVCGQQKYPPLTKKRIIP